MIYLLKKYPKTCNQKQHYSRINFYLYFTRKIIIQTARFDDNFLFRLFSIEKTKRFEVRISSSFLIMLPLGEVNRNCLTLRFPFGGGIRLNSQTTIFYCLPPEIRVFFRYKLPGQKSVTSKK